MIAHLKREYPAYTTELSSLDVEEAIYWFAADFHDGQGSNLYAALSVSPLRPGILSDGPETDLGQLFLDELVGHFGLE
jgi:hypothetical protein